MKVTECISPQEHYKEICVKVTEYILQQEIIKRKVVLKLRNANHLGSSSLKESSVKVTECISSQEFIRRKVVLKVRNGYHIRSLS